MGLFSKPPVRSLGDGVFELAIAPDEREVLAHFLSQLRELLLTDDPSLRRLYPDAYLDNAPHEEEFRRLMRGELIEARFAALDTVEATLSRSTLDEEELTQWMLALNALRLVIGTRLDVGEDQRASDLDPQNPDAPLFQVYEYLAYLLDAVVQALASGP